MYLTFRTCICGTHFPHEKIIQSPTTSIKCIFLSNTSSTSHILSEKHIHMHSDTKWDLSSVLWELVTKLTLWRYLIIAFKIWYMTQCVGTGAGILTTIYLSLIYKSSVRKLQLKINTETLISFVNPMLKVETKDLLTLDQVFRSIACLSPPCLHAETKWPQLLS